MTLPREEEGLGQSLQSFKRRNVGALAEGPGQIASVSRSRASVATRSSSLPVMNMEGISDGFNAERFVCL